MFSCFALALLAVSAVKSDCNSAQTYYIRTALNGLTLDGTTTDGLIQSFTGSQVQQWRFECGAQPGLYYIVNVASGNVLDIERYNPAFGQYIYINPRDGTFYQQWSLDARGRIVNAAFGHNMAVRYDNFEPGASVWLYYDNGSISQQFILQEKI